MTDNQIQAKITNFFVQLDDESLLGEITYLRLKKIQLQLGLTNGLLDQFNYDYTPNKFYGNYLFEMLLLCKQTNISMSSYQKIKDRFKIKGGSNPIIDLLPFDSRSPNVVRHMITNNIFYLEQLVSENGTRLLGWVELKKRYTTMKSSSPPNWYLGLVKEICTGNSLEIGRSFQPYRMINNISTTFTTIEERISDNRQKIRAFNNNFIAYYCHVTSQVYVGKEEKKKMKDI